MKVPLSGCLGNCPEKMSNPLNPLPTPAEESRSGVHVRGPLMLGKIPLHPFSGGRIFVVDQIILNIEFELETQLGQWTAAQFTNSKGDMVVPSRVSRLIRVALSFFAMSCQPEELQPLMFDHAGFVVAALQFWDGLGREEVQQAFAIYDRKEHEVREAQVEVVRRGRKKATAGDAGSRQD